MPTMKPLLLGSFCVLALAFQVKAYESASVLPKGVRNGGFRFGVYTGLSDKFNSDGSLIGIGDSMSLEVTPGTIANLDPQGARLIEALNQIGNQRLGDQFHPGNVFIEVNPVIQYSAVIFGYGINSRWSLGLGVPVIRYTNQVRIRTDGSNLDEIRKRSGGLHPELDAGLTQFSEGMPALVERKAAEYGYYLPSDVDQTFLGDLSVVSMFQVFKETRWRSVLKTTMNLPTGPGDNPDDLTDLANFRQTYFQAAWLQDFEPWNSWTFGFRGGYQINLPDQIEKRVPEAEGQYFVSEDRKEVLQRDRGDLGFVELNLRHMPWDFLEFAAGVEQSWKASDDFSGARNFNYSLLEKNTSAQWTKIRGSVELNTVKPFLKKLFDVPALVSYTYSDLLAGRNVERQTNHEINLSLFF